MVFWLSEMALPGPWYGWDKAVIGMSPMYKKEYTLNSLMGKGKDLVIGEQKICPMGRTEITIANLRLDLR